VIFAGSEVALRSAKKPELNGGGSRGKRQKNTWVSQASLTRLSARENYSLGRSKNKLPNQHARIGNLKLRKGEGTAWTVINRDLPDASNIRKASAGGNRKKNYSQYGSVVTQRTAGAVAGVRPKFSEDIFKWRSGTILNDLRGRASKTI